MQTLQTATVPQLLNSPFNYDRSWVHLSDIPKLCILTKACFEKSFIVSTNYPKSKNIHRTCLVVARHTTRIVPRLYLVVPFLKAAIIMQIIEKRPKKNQSRSTSKPTAATSKNGVKGPKEWGSPYSWCRSIARGKFYGSWHIHTDLNSRDPAPCGSKQAESRRIPASIRVRSSWKGRGSCNCEYHDSG